MERVADPSGIGKIIHKILPMSCKRLRKIDETATQDGVLVCLCARVISRNTYCKIFIIARFQGLKAVGRVALFSAIAGNDVWPLTQHRSRLPRHTFTLFPYG